MFNWESEAFMAARAGYRTVARRTNASPVSEKPGHSFLEGVKKASAESAARLLPGSAFTRLGLGGVRSSSAFTATVKMELWRLRLSC
jgi:hypothetical protein